MQSDNLGEHVLSAGSLVVGTVRVKTFKLSGVPSAEDRKLAHRVRQVPHRSYARDWRKKVSMR
jgi:hypothetical protein